MKWYPRRARKMVWLDWLAAGFLLVAAGYSWWHAEYGSTAFIAGCSGFVFGIASLRTMDWYLWRDYP